jgi:hypothetical protein
VLSVAMPRATVAGLDFERLDPSEAIANLIHRGDFKASRKAGAFMPITPLTPADLPQASAPQDLDVPALFAEAHKIRDELKTANAGYKAAQTASASGDRATP